MQADMDADLEVKEFLQSMERLSSRSKSSSASTASTNELLAGDSALWAVDASKFFGHDDEM